jgi:error-prone DNA polymerase
MTDRYVELHAASAFSFLEGASQPEKLVERAVELEMPAMALVDRNGVYGSARFHTSAKRSTIRAHVGAEIAVSDIGLRLAPPLWLPHQHVKEPARIPLLCESREGYQNLCQLITRFKMRETSKQEGAATCADLQQYASGLVCLTKVRWHPPWHGEAKRLVVRQWNGWSASLGGRTSTSNCNGIRNARKSGAIKRRFASHDH